MRISYLLIALLWSINCVSQYSNEYLEYKSKFPEENLVRLTNEKHIIIAIEHGEIVVSQETLETDLYLNEAATYNSKSSLQFSAFFELMDVEASSFIFQKGKYKELKVEEFLEKDDLESSFHDDSKSLNFVLPSLEEGSKSQIHYTENVKNPRFLSPFYLADFFPIANNTITIEVDNDIALTFQSFNTEQLDINFTKEEKKNKTIYKWQLNHVESLEFEGGLKSYQSIMPHIIPIISSYTVNSEKITLAETPEHLYNWYFSMVKEVNQKNASEELVNQVNQITANCNSDLEKVKAIYYWTQNNIKYIAFEYGLGGFIPREANDVYSKKYGDCKDNSSLLHEMLKIAGLKGELTWIGTRKIPYSYNQVPTPIVDNHMILSYKDENDIYFLDATSRFTPLEYPTSFIQGKEALIGNGEQSYEIVNVPIIEASKNSIKDFSTIRIEDQTLVGHSKTTISGYIKIDFFNYLEPKEKAEDVSSFYNLNFEKGNNSFLIENLKETNKYSYDKDFLLEYDFSIQDHIKSFENEVYINLNLNKDLSSYIVEKNRIHPIDFDYKIKNEYHTKFNLPEGYRINYLPENFEVNNELISIQITYKLIDNTIHYTHSYSLNFLTLNKEQQVELNSIIKKTEKAYKELIILSKK
ncbi:MAG: transglutaminase [Bacteroidetes bacterium MedPE-SWsnd-G2]|nr:MAG: transglutaminase [Bacteroidetes bacterium MedPE-SWsnd-G2]